MSDDERQQTESELDETLEETFPASDAPANTVETGIVPRELPQAFAPGVIDNRDASRFEMLVEEQTAFLTYKRGLNSVTLVHTEVPEDLRHRGLGTALVKAAIGKIRTDGLQVIAECAFAKDYLRKHRSG